MSEAGTTTDDRGTLPIGVVTFLLTDVEASTSRWQAEPDAMAAATGRHYEILDAAIELHGGVRPQEQGEGDSVVAVFRHASDALAAAIDAQIGLLTEDWPTAAPLRVRMGIHTGEARRRGDDNYVGLTVVRAARVRNLAAGGQVLVTAATRDVALDRLPSGVELLDLGEHRLKDLTRPEHLFQLAHPSLPADFPELASSDTPPHNLPVDLSTFVGRGDEIRTLGALLERERLVTVVGSGGAGKTRLAMRCAAASVERFSSGVWWVELAAASEISAVGASLASALGTSSTDPSRYAESAALRVGDGHALVVFDNCEHLGDEPARVATLLLGRCPNLHILATSRRALDCGGEVAWRIPAMATPDDALASIAELELVDSVSLFLERSQRVRPSFHLDEDNAADVAAICRRLGGIPLAIELAAARIKSMLPGQICEGLDDALHLLGHGPRTLSPRHRTIDASIRWSYELLSAPEARLLERISVFRGSFDLSAAEAVCADAELPEPAVLDALDGLIDQSLVRVVGNETDRRFGVLEPVGQFGHGRLRAQGTVDRWRARHAAHYARVADECGPRCETADQFAALAVLDVEHDNLRVALAWLLDSGDRRDFVDMVLALGGYWDVGGDKLEGEVWSGRALDVVADGDLVRRSRLLALRAECRHSIGNYLGALEDGRAAFELGSEAGDALGSGRGSSTVTSILSHVDLDRWRDQWDTTVALLTEAGDDYTLAGTMTWGAVPLLRRGRINEGMAALERARPVVEATGSPLLIASQQSWEAYAELTRGDPARAEGLVRAAIESGSMRSHARAQGVRTILKLALAHQGLSKQNWRQGLADLERSRRRGEHFAVDNDLIVTATSALRPNPFAAIELVDQWLKDHEDIESTQHPEALLIGAHGALALGNLDDAERRARAALESARRVQHVLVEGRAQTLLAAVALEHHETRRAEELTRDAIGRHSEHGAWPAMWEGVAVLGSIAAACGDLVEAARLLGALGQGGRAAAFDRMRTTAEATLRAQMDPADLAAATAQGTALGNSEMLDLIERSRGARGRPTLGWDSLTPTEHEVAQLVREGLTNREVGDQLLMGAETVKTHVSHIFRKLGINRRAQLAALVVEQASQGASGDE